MTFSIVHHHVGARGNVRLPLDDGSPIRRDLGLYYYDADPDAIDPALERRILAGTVELKPYCIADKPGRRPFHLAVNRFASSLYPHNPRYDDFVSRGPYGQSRLGDTARTDQTEELEVTTLDALCVDRAELPPPDYLSIDTEGGESLVLEGARTVLRRDVLWLKTETWIHPIRQGARTFSVILNELDQAGFDLVSLEQYQPFSPMPLPVSMVGDGFLLGGEAVFARRLESFDSGPIADLPIEERLLRLYKLAFLAAMHGQVAYAILCLKRATALGGDFFESKAEASQTAYLRFLSRLQAIHEAQDSAWPTYVDFDPVRRRLRRLFERITENIEPDPENAKRAEHADRQAFLKSLARTLSVVEHSYWIESTPLETLYRQFGMTGVARDLRELRKEAAETFLKQYHGLKHSRL